MKATLHNRELPLPPFFDPNKVADWKWVTNKPERFADALKLVATHNIRPAALDQLKIALVPIDNQLTFCHPDFELFVGGKSGRGAIDDTRRLCEFIYRNLGVLTRIFPTLDTHTAWQIFHAAFLIDPQGGHPDPRYPMLISLADVEAGKWQVDPKAAFAITGDARKYAALQAHFVHYARKLSEGGKYPLTIWPFHAMLGEVSHALMPSLFEACFVHSIARGSGTDFKIKGGNPLTENYSVLAPEVLSLPDGRPIPGAQKNTDFLKVLLNHDVVIIAGQAKSHCVAWTIADLLGEITAQDPALARKVYLLEDCTSNVVVPGVVDFSQQGDEAFERFAAAGMHVVSSTTPIGQWPDIDVTLLAG